jgi:hypothetical protein
MRRGRERDRGAVLIEAAFVFPVLIMFVFGIIEYGLVFKDTLTLSSATRSGARIASAEPKQASYDDNAASAAAAALTALPSSGPQELWVYKAFTDGLPCLNLLCASSTPFTTYCSVCTIYSWQPATRSFLEVPVTVHNNVDWNATGTNSQNACAGTPDSLGVYVKIQHKFITGLFGSVKTLTDHTVFRLEPFPGAGCNT